LETKRRVVEHSNGTKLISLPKSWCSNHQVKGKESLRELANGILIIFPNDISKEKYELIKQEVLSW